MIHGLQLDMQRKSCRLNVLCNHLHQPNRMAPSFITLALALVLFLEGMTVPLLSQRNFTLSGRIGYSYSGRNPSSKDEEGWSYHQKFISLDLNGFLWDRRFITFTLSGNYADTGFSQALEGSNFANIGYQVQANFFPGKKINFGLSYGKNKLSFDQFVPTSASAATYNTHSTNKDLFLNILRIKFLPEIRLNYSDRKNSSEILQMKTEAERRLDLSAVKTIGISHLDLRYRYLNRENQFLTFDTSHQNLRIIERFDFSPDTRLYLNGDYFDYSVKLPDETSVGSHTGGFSLHFNKKFSPKLLGSLRYNYNLRGGDDAYKSRSHQVGLRVSYNLSDYFVLTPEINYYTDRISLEGNQDHITEPALGLRLSFQKDIAKIRLTSSVGVMYRKQRSDLKGDIDDFSQFYSISLNAGHAEKLLGSLTYSYSRINLDTSVSNNLEVPFYFDIGRKQNNHQARLELRSNALRFLNIYLYSNYQRYETEYPVQGITDNQTFNNGITLSLKRISFSADYEVSRFDIAEESIDYDSYLLVLDIRLIRGLDFRAQSIKRTRTDILFLGDFELIQEAYLRYNIGKFFLSAIYRRRRANLQNFERDDEGIYFRISRSFDLAF